MLIVKDLLISDAVIEEQFLCNLTACKGACCWEGDYGAPLEKEELQTLEHIYEDVKPFLSPAGIKVIEEKGLYTYVKETRDFATTLIDGGPCAYMTKDKNGIAQCGIEQAYNNGETTFRKPISCHLYPIRVQKNEEGSFEALNYDQWDICSAACTLGKKEQLPIYRFVKAALIRKYGKEFYEELEAAVEHMKNNGQE